MFYLLNNLKKQILIQIISLFDLLKIDLEESISNIYLKAKLGILILGALIVSYLGFLSAIITFFIKINPSNSLNILFTLLILISIAHLIFGLIFIKKLRKGKERKPFQGTLNEIKKTLQCLKNKKSKEN